MEPEVLILDRFLDEASCARIRAAMDAGEPEPAEVLTSTIDLDEHARRAAHVEIDEETRAFVESRLDAVRSRIAAHFRVRLAGREGVSLLRYGPGGFFRRHRDWGEVAAWPDAARRRISVVVFLTTATDQPPHGTSEGGTLRLFPDEAASYTLNIHPRTGTLVAFPSTMVHEVTDVRAGIRDTVVDWFY